MSRPTKQGLEYFPVDVQYDDKIELLIAEKGSNAVSVLLTVWQLIYQNNGYYVENGKDLFLLVKRRIMLDTNIIEEIINCALERDIFNQKLYEEFNILTSRGVQKRYFIAASRKKRVNVYKNYLLVSINDCNNVTCMDINDIKNATKEEVEVKEEEKKKSISSKSISWASLKVEYDPNHVSLTKWFLTKQKKGFPNFIKEEILPNSKRVQNSLITLEQLCRIDQFNFKKDVEPILRAVVRDDFWARNLLSLASLRNKSQNGETKFVNIVNTIKMPNTPKEEKSIKQLAAELEKEIKTRQKCPDLSALPTDSREYSMWTNVIPHPAKIVELYTAWLEDQSWIGQIQPGHFDFAGKTFQLYLAQANKDYGVNIITGIQC